ncbi:helix-turn-helix domain-containing protein [Leucobacter muris]|nr:helix-turn-helix transcriptional regulator [Leucobacter muris]
MPSGFNRLPGPLSKAVGDLLFEIMDAKSLTQRAVAEAAGMSEAQYSRAVRGLKVFSLEQLDAVCSAVDESISDVIREAENRTGRGGVAAAAPPISLSDRRANVSGGGEDEPDIPENVLEEWAGRYAAHPDDGEPEDHTP